MNYNLIISCILLLIIILKIYNKIDMTIHTIIAISVVTVILLLKMNSKEHLSQTETIQTISSLYNTQQMTVTNLTVTGKLTVGDPATNNIKMVVNDTSDNNGNNVKMEKCNLLANTSTVNTLTVGTTNANSLNVSGTSSLGETNISGSSNISGSVNISGKTTTQDLDVSGLAQQIFIVPTGTARRPGKAFLKDGDNLKFVLNGQTYPENGGWAVGDNWEIGFKGKNTSVSEPLILVSGSNRDTSFWSPKFQAQKV
jgi:hypothetical protein